MNIDKIVIILIIGCVIYTLTLVNLIEDIYLKGKSKWK